MLYDKRWEKEVEVVLEPWQQIIVGAIEVLETQGWIQGSTSSLKGFCIAGALAHAHNKLDPTPEDTSDKVINTISNLIHHHSITGWNDTRGRTKDEVINLLRAAAYGHSQG